MSFSSSSESSHFKRLPDRKICSHGALPSVVLVLRDFIDCCLMSMEECTVSMGFCSLYYTYNVEQIASGVLGLSQFDLNKFNVSPMHIFNQ